MTYYLIDFKNDVSDEQIAMYLAENQCTVLKAFDKLNKVYHVESTILPPITSIVELVQNDNESTIELLEAIPLYSYPSVEETVTVDHSDDKNWWKVYSYKEIDLANDTTPVPIFGSGSNIYILDSGIDISHPEFEGKDVTLLHSMVPNDFDDYNGHGTALASVMIGKTCGISNASLKVVKIFSNDPTNNPTKQSDLLYAFDAILTDIINSPNLFSVVNLSWTINKNEYIENKIRHLINAGVYVIVSAGNSGRPIEEVTPASMPDVITVGAYQESFTPCNFSNYTDPSITSLTKNFLNSGALDIWAPGEKIWAALTSIKGGGYGFTAGTSVATAIQSAAIAFNIAQENYGKDSVTAYLDIQNRVVLDFPVRFGRQGLLDLSDPKYINSVNKICTFAHIEQHDKGNNVYTNKLYNPLAPERKLVVSVNEKTVTRIAGPLFSKYELKNPLPDWATIDGPWLVVHPTVEPEDGPEGVQGFGIQFILYPEDDGVDPIERTILVVVAGSLVDKEVVPSDPDSPLNLLLQGFCDTIIFNNRLTCSFNCQYQYSACGFLFDSKQCICNY